MAIYDVKIVEEVLKILLLIVCLWTESSFNCIFELCEHWCINHIFSSSLNDKTKAISKTWVEMNRNLDWTFYR